MDGTRKKFKSAARAGIPLDLATADSNEVNSHMKNKNVREKRYFVFVCLNFLCDFREFVRQGVKGRLNGSKVKGGGTHS